MKKTPLFLVIIICILFYGLFVISLALIVESINNAGGDGYSLRFIADAADSIPYIGIFTCMIIAFLKGDLFRKKWYFFIVIFALFIFMSIYIVVAETNSYIGY